MSKLILVILMLSLSGCSTVGKILSGAGQGLASSSGDQRPANCTMTQVYGTNYYEGKCQ